MSTSSHYLSICIIRVTRYAIVALLFQEPSVFVRLCHEVIYIMCVPNCNNLQTESMGVQVCDIYHCLFV